MESKEDSVRVKQEPFDTCTEAGDDCNYNLVDTCKIKNFDTFSFHESSTNNTNEVMAWRQEKLDEKIFIDLECKDVKLEFNSLSAKICKTEYQNYPSIVKIENKTYNGKASLNAHMNTTHKGITLYECDVIQKSFGCKNNLNKHINSVHDFEYDICQKFYSRKAHIDALNNLKKPFECDICNKSFGQNYILKRHINAVHNSRKPFELPSKGT
ncbi:zinc finger protein OZF-like [Trichogramma pretiosum]|uniref:zinc finger protein OZF-like n=1 Tax=Trichogramma pretiosum TaxID=7493 RepID=UPI000C71BF3F|nr:zinc finger protein OZF-like [Trichogramma pretiosum]